MDITVSQGIEQFGSWRLHAPDGRELDLIEFLAFRVITPLIDDPAVTPEVLISMVEARGSGLGDKQFLDQKQLFAQTLKCLRDAKAQFIEHVRWCCKHPYRKSGFVNAIRKHELVAAALAQVSLLIIEPMGTA